MNETEQMLTEILGCRRVDLFVEKPGLSPRQQDRLRQMQDRRRGHEPLQYILGSVDFMGLRLAVDPRVLIPRPETELLVEAVLERVSDKAAPLNILDLGTGSGNIAIALAKHLPRSRVTAMDLSDAALDVARLNAAGHAVEDRVSFVQRDLRQCAARPRPEAAKFDIVVSNPPYIPYRDVPFLPPDVRQEPWVALDGGDDGLECYRAIISGLRHLLVPGGFLALELGDGQAGPVSALWRQRYGGIVRHIKDYVGTDRVLIGQLSSV